MEVQCGKLHFRSTGPKQMSLICSMQNSTCPGQFSTRPAQNALASASGLALVSLTEAAISSFVWFLSLYPVIVK